MTSIHIADTGLFVALGQPSNRRYRAVRTFAYQNDITFVLPERVYKELTVPDDDTETPPVDTAIAEDWVRIGPSLDYTDSLVSSVMDGVQRYIANEDERPADQVERADSALAGVAAQALVDGTTTDAYIYTTDIAAGEGAEAVLASEGYGDAVTFVNGFRLIEELL